jgi:hypothetical protein
MRKILEGPMAMIIIIRNVVKQTPYTHTQEALLIDSKKKSWPCFYIMSARTKLFCERYASAHITSTMQIAWLTGK